MKKAIIVLLLLCFAAAAGFSQEDAEIPMFGLSVVFTDSIAFFGLGGEMYLGNLGLGATFTTFFFGGQSGYVFFYEPGVYARYYFFGPAASMYIGAGATYFSFFGRIENTDFDVDEGLININGLVGFNAMFGDKKEFRFAIELGPRFTLPTASSGEGFFFPHFLFQFGMNI